MISINKPFLHQNTLSGQHCKCITSEANGGLLHTNFYGLYNKLLKIMTVLGKLGFSVEVAGFHAFSSQGNPQFPVS